MNGGQELDLNAIRRRLGALHGRPYWEALDEVAGSEAFASYVREHYPSQQHRWLDGVLRRDFLKLMGASLALGGLGACTRQPTELILPYARSPEAIVPGRPIYFATAMPLGQAALGLLIESHMGRPTKAEGNPEHPSSLGATDVFAQASLLTMYDPDRSQAIHKRGRIATWPAFLEELSQAMAVQRARQGAGLRVLSETITSPTLNAQRIRLLEAFPSARWLQWDPVNRDAARAGARLAFGEDLTAHHDFARADVVVALGADCLWSGPARVQAARAFAARRRSEQPNRLYVLESAPSITGASADHRLALRTSEIEGVSRALARALGVPVTAPPIADRHAAWVAAIAEDLRAHRGASVVVAGEAMAPSVHALAHAINAALDNAGKTVTYTAPIELVPSDQTADLARLASEARAGTVEALVILSSNPVFSAPADLGFGAALDRVPLRIRVGLYDDETSNLCHWHIPESHFLESWSDTRAHDGTWSTVQPLIAPLYDSKTVHEVVAAMLGEGIATSHDIVRAHWQATLGTSGFESKWRQALHDGFVASTSLPPRTPRLQALELGESTPAGGLELVLRPDPTIWDGRFANNGWLQELPKPFTRLTWDNAAQLGPQTARRLGVQDGDVVELAVSGRSVRAPVWVVPAHAEESITVHVGHGRTRAGRTGTGVGFDAYRLQSARSPWLAVDLELRKTGERAVLASTQEHHRMEGRDIARIEGIGRGAEHEQAHGEHADSLSLFPPHPYPGDAWGLVIDLNACIGCSVCTIACQAENNIPVVGKDQVVAGRAMHWMRVDHYEKGAGTTLSTVHQPVPCMHCENAPCEVVCPVGATVHSDEGLNEMVYNRCVGTRYCSNNCPYKVRRFNFLAYSDDETESLKLMRNPDVTVRTRGVMEKCTYCVQRISAARIQAKKEERPIRDGDIRTACEAACPTQAIVFGSINDPHSRIARLRESPHHYALLEELNTRPRTTYLSKRLNPNPKLSESA